MGDNRQSSTFRKVIMRLLAVIILLFTSYMLWDFYRLGFDYFTIVVMGVLFGGISLGLFYFANKPLRKSGVVPVDKPKRSSIRIKPSFRHTFRHHDIFAMVILHEGYLPVTQPVTPREIAEEILSDSQVDERLMGVQLAPAAIIEMKRADEAKYWQDGVYEPMSELRELMDECMVKVKQIYDSHDPVLNKVPARLLTFKSHSKMVGTLYVSMYILI